MPKLSYFFALWVEISAAYVIMLAGYFMKSLTELYKIGRGPSSSHNM